MKELADVDLVQLWAEGDRTAGNELVSRYFADLRTFLVNSVPDQDCADVLQEVFARVVAATERFANQSSFRTYLYAIARNTVADYFRKKYADKHFDPATSSVEDISGINPSTAVAQLQQCRRLNACLRQLCIDDRELLELFYWHDLQGPELAEVFAVPTPTIRTRLHRARKRLEVLLESCVEETEHGEVVAELEEQLLALGHALGARRKAK